MKWIAKIVGQTLCDYDLTQSGDRILTAVSGGKDSWSLLHLLHYFKAVGPVSFDLIAITIDPGFPGFDIPTIQTQYEALGIDYRIERTNIAETIAEKNEPGNNPCAFCARLRRGALYRMADALGCNKVALGHHADDAIETMLLSSFYEGALTSMPPRLEVHDGSLTLIRPLIRVFENDLREYSQKLGVTTVDCTHVMPDRPRRRKEIKELIRTLAEKNPKLKKSMLASLHHLHVSHFLDSQWL
jgi:tRNA 2-thiocytidine biosynthesis protein TtcA